MLLPLALTLCACVPSGSLPPAMFSSDDEPVDVDWCTGMSELELDLCSYADCSPLPTPALLGVARRPQNAVTAMVGVKVAGLDENSEVGELDLQFVDDQGFALCSRQRRHLNTLCRESGDFVLEAVELYFDPEPHPQSWDGIEGTLSATIEVDGEILAISTAARLQTETNN